MKKKGFIILIITLVALSLLVWFYTKKKSDKVPVNQARMRTQIKVEGYIVKPSQLIDEIRVSGTLMPEEEVELRNEVSGRVTELNLPEGQSVKKGTLLVRLYDEDILAVINKLENQLALQQKILERQTELVKVNGISQNDFDQTGLQVNSLKADIAYQKALLRKNQILAPFDGVIGLRNISIGAQLSSGTIVATLRSENQLKLDFSVPEKYGPVIEPGMDVVFVLDNQDTEYHATVFATEREIDVTNRNLKVRARVEKNNGMLMPGAFASVQIQMGKNPNALLIPTQAIIPGEKDKSVIVARKGKAHFTLIKTGLRRSADIEILDGLKTGDTVITTGLLFLKEGVKLQYETIKTDSL
jgi:membrane fusion protein, multidrug efflux system